MRILITGGAGFIASHIQDAYLAAGHEVAVIDNLSSGQKRNLQPQTRFYPGDIRQLDFEKIFEEFRPEILNLHAAQINVRKSVENPIEDAEINGIALLRILESARKYSVRKIIFASSGGAIYGEQDYFPADESHPTQPLSPYGITKLLGEKYLEFYRHTYGLPYVALRYANVYGPRQNPLGEAGVISIFLDKLQKGERATIYGDGEQTRDYVDVSDVVRANQLALQDDMQGIFNVGTGVETSVNQLYGLILEHFNLDRAAQYEKAKAGEARRSAISPAKLRQRGWAAPRSLDEGLKKLAQIL